VINQVQEFEYDLGRYESAHHEAIRDVLQYITMYALHLAVNSLTHDPAER
jgi:hypothetical protein